MENSIIKIFENQEFGKIRITEKNGEIYFILKDLCDVLEIKNPSDTIKSLDPKGVANSYTLTNGGKQRVLEVNESNFYQLIFISRKENAIKFKNWVTSEVLPKIRKTGSFSLENFKIDSSFLEKLTFEMKKLENKIQEDKPKVENYDKFLNSDGLFLVKTVAADCGYKMKEFFELLQIKKIIYKTSKNSKNSYYLPHAGYEKLFKLVSHVFEEECFHTLKITPFGRQELVRKFSIENSIPKAAKKIQNAEIF